MASGKTEVKMIIAKSMGSEWVILQCPKSFKQAVDGLFCCDNGFVESTYPEESGIYEVDCEVFWDDGENGFFERIDPDWKIRIISYNQLLKIA